MKTLTALLITFSLLAADAPKKPAAKAPVKDTYDPDKLRPGEIACGRMGAKNAAPCSCMRTRFQKSQAAIKVCYNITDDEKRGACLDQAGKACSVEVTDVDAAMGNDMPIECKRSCTKSRCECCRT